jgi:hypothetical protein
VREWNAEFCETANAHVGVDELKDAFPEEDSPAIRRRMSMDRGPFVEGLTSQKKSLFMVLLAQAENSLNGVFTA